MTSLPIRDQIKDESPSPKNAAVVIKPWASRNHVVSARSIVESRMPWGHLTVGAQGQATRGLSA
jgi:hypothetical protein